ncbi:MAG TPA: hypothetical protein PK250_10000 [Syntrophobacter fumaroxidans]|nr:hypothetical protein [Syntrophobacter fumaroxidans]
MIVNPDPLKPTFTQDDILGISGIPAGRVQNWLNRGHIKIAQKSPGKGKHRLYTFPEAVKIQGMNHLSFSKRGPAENSQLAELLGQRAEELAQAGRLEPQGLKEELAQEALIYHFERNGELKHCFVRKDQFKIYDMGTDFSFFDADDFITRFWEELVYNYRTSQPKEFGCDETGWPEDPDHPWNREKSK